MLIFLPLDFLLIKLSTDDPICESISIEYDITLVPTEEPVLLSIDDVPDDQGGDVIIEFTRSYFDDDGFLYDHSHLNFNFQRA